MAPIPSDQWAWRTLRPINYPFASSSSTHGHECPQQRCWQPGPGAKQHAVQSEAVSQACITLTLHTLFPGLAGAARSSLASFPLKVQISHTPAALEGWWACLGPPPYFLAWVLSASAFLSISTTFFSSLVRLWHTFSPTPGTIFPSTSQNDELKIFLSRRIQDLSFNFSLFTWLLRKTIFSDWLEDFTWPIWKKPAFSSQISSFSF